MVKMSLQRMAVTCWCTRLPCSLKPICKRMSAQLWKCPTQRWIYANKSPLLVDLVKFSTFVNSEKIILDSLGSHKLADLEILIKY